MKLRRLVDLTAFGQDSLGMALHKQGIEEQISALEGSQPADQASARPMLRCIGKP